VKVIFLLILGNLKIQQKIGEGGRKVLAIKYAKEIHYYYMDTGNPVATFDDVFTDWVWDISFSQDNSMIIGCDDDGKIRVWAETGGAPLLAYTDGTSIGTCIFSPDQTETAYLSYQYASSGGSNYRLKKRKISDGTVTLDYYFGTVGTVTNIRNLKFLPNSELFTFSRKSASNELAFFNPTTSADTKVLTYNGGINTYLFSYDGSKVYIAGYDEKVSLWDISGTKTNMLWETDVLATANFVGFTKSTMEDFLIVTSKDNKIIQIKTSDGTIMRQSTLSNPLDADDTLGSVIITDDGKRLIVSNKKINVLNFADFSVIKTISLPGADNFAHTIALSNCGSCFTSLDSTSKKCKSCESTSGLFFSLTRGFIF
jgi:WD40 repeat protein